MPDQEELWKAEIESLHNLLEEARRELERRYTDIEAIYRIVRTIYGALDPAELTKAVKAILEESLEVAAYSLTIFNSEDREFLFQAEKGLSAETVRRILNEMDEREPEWMTDPRAARKVVGLKTREHAPLSFMCIPLHSQRTMAGSLCAPTADFTRFNKQDLDIIAIITTQIAIAMESNRLYRLTKELSITDETTDVYNYRHFRRRLTVELERAKRYQRPVSLDIMGVDSFAEFQQELGKEKADAALHDIGSILKNHLRKVDTIARYGESEFALILPETDEMGALVVAEKARKAVADYLFMGEKERNRKLTVSVGGVCYPQHIAEPAEVIPRAKEALVQAQKMGKNKTVIAKTETSVLLPE